MILVNVLLIVALAAGVLAIMISTQELAIERSTRLRQAAEALAAAEGGILSAQVALRRDMAAAPDSDYAAEPWGRIAERGAGITRGRFQLAVGDAQGRFNVNTLVPGGSGARPLFARLAVEARLTPAAIQGIETLLAQGGPIAEVADLRRAGLDDAQLAALAPFVTALPAIDTPLNLNAVDQPLLALILNDAGAARFLADERARLGRLTPDSFRRLGVSLPPGAGFASAFYWARSRVAIGDATQQITALLARRRPQGRPQVAIVARWRGAAVPPDAPPLPELPR